MYCLPEIVYGTNVRTGEAVSYFPCEECQICRVAPGDAFLNGYGGSSAGRRTIPRSDKLRGTRHPLKPFHIGHARNGLHAEFLSAARHRASGASTKLTSACLALSNETGVIFPAIGPHDERQCLVKPRPRRSRDIDIL